MNRSQRVLLVLVALSLTILAVGTAQPELFKNPRNWTDTVAGRLEEGMSSVVRPAEDLWGRLSGSSTKELESLRNENDALRLEIGTQQDTQGKLSQLQSMLGTQSLLGMPVVPAVVIAWNSDRGFAHTVEIDAGSRDGIQTDMTVIAGGGLIGRTVNVGPWTSTVVLISDPQVSVGTRVGPERTLSYVEGTAEATLQLTGLDPTATIEVGQQVVTAGSLGETPYVPGVPVGTISTVEATPGSLTRAATVAPAADLNSLGIVGVVIPSQRTKPRSSIDGP